MTSQKCQFGGAKVRLGDVLIQTFSGEWGSEEGDHLTPVLRTSNFNDDGTFDYASPAWRCIPEKKVVSKRLYRGDIVLEKSGGTPKRPVGIMSYYDSDQLALCSNFNQVLRVNSELMHPKYAFFQLRWLKHHNAFERYTRKTTGLQNIQMKKFVNLMILCPEISIQQEVVEQLEAISRQIKHFEYISSRLETLVKSRFVEMFVDRGFPTVKFGDYCEHVNNGMTRRGNDKDGSIVLRLVELQEGYIDYSKVNRIVLTGKERAKFLLHDCDILFARVNGNSDNVGRCAAFVDIGESVYHNDHIIRATVASGSFVSEYLVYYMNSPYGREQIDKSLKTSAGQYTINQEGVKDIYLPIPPLHLQQEFAAFVRQADKLRQAA